jgi:Predicted nucleic acid-binding protein, contains PIN domain
VAEGGEEREVGYVLESSAIGALLERMKDKGLIYLKGSLILDLTLYELGNVIWKACRLRRVISEKEAMEGVKALAKVLELTRRVELKGREMEEVMKLALGLGLTFYDAFYLYLAKSKDCVLVTEDEELLRQAVVASVRAISVEEYLSEFAPK